MTKKNGKQFDLIVWDWDGTVADSTGMIAHVFIKAAEQVGLSGLTLDKARSVIGLGLRESIDRLFADVPAEQAQALIKQYSVNYNAAEQEVPLFGGAKALMMELNRRGYKLAVATGMVRQRLELALQRSGFAKYLNATKTIDECFSKPHPQMLNELMDELVVTPERTIMIGDSSYDLQMAQNAGVQSLAVTFGAHSSEKLLKCDPKGIFNTFNDLSDWLLNNA